MALKTTEYTIFADIPQALAFLFVSDLHDCPNKPILDLIRRQTPDAILVGGDFVHNAKQYGRGLEFLRDAAKIAPTFVSIGNHERHLGRSVKVYVSETGAVLLDNSFTRFGGVTIGGLSSGYGYGPQKREKITPAPETDWLDDFERAEGFKLLLSHHPEYYDEYIKPRKINLTLSGHAHGGQWRFFGRGLISPGQGIFPKYTSGLYDGRLIVGRGLGNPYMIPRINNSPEVIKILLGRENFCGK